ncbi:MAG: hypothetical protein QME74_11460 [Candidatus Edwardsbacteria bacterium]|nr:hypothetical protein [Candidatus Edwardsbacteria bacterium]
MYQIPYYEDKQGVGPCGSIISTIDDLSKWLVALMNGGTYKEKQVVPLEVIRVTLAPTNAFPNKLLENRGYGELLNPAYGMGRSFASYRGHFLTDHGGNINGIHSQISCMPSLASGCFSQKIVKCRRGNSFKGFIM